MPTQARSLRTRSTMNENDENRPSTRLTRAKAAALSAGDVSTAATKKPLESKKAATSTATAGTTRKRAALGDVSNVTKGENGAAKEGKKPAGAKVGLTSKATMQAGGVAKLTRTNSSRTTALTNKKYASKKFLKASILTRQWAKKYHHLYIDSSLSEPYNYIKDHE